MVRRVRPSSGAETLENYAAFEVSDTPERANVAAAGDGHTPANRHEACPTLNPPRFKTAALPPRRFALDPRVVGADETRGIRAHRLRCAD